MNRLVQALAAWGVLSAAGAWAWWVSGHRVSDALGGVVLIVVLVGAFGVYLVVDRKRHGAWLCFGGYGAAVLVSGVHVWFDGLLPIARASSFGAYSEYVDRLGSWGEVLLAAPLPAFFIGAILWVDVVVKSLEVGRGEDRRPRADSDLYGRARFLGARYMRRLAGRRGMLLGGWGERRAAPLIGWELEGSALTIAPPRGGKGALITLNLLSPARRGPAGSTVLIDPRGEIWCVVARRRREMGRRVLLMDPFGVVADHAVDYPHAYIPDSRSARYNPLDFIREEEGAAVRDIYVLVDALLTPPGSGTGANSRHFYESASAIIAGYIAYVRFREGEGKRNLKRVHELLSMSPEGLKAFAKEKSTLGRFAGGLFHLALERQAQVAGEEAGSNFTTIANQLQFMTFPEIAVQTASSNFDPCWLARGDTDVFVVVPEEVLEHAKGWLRLWIAIPNAVASRKPLERDLMIMIDEMPRLGYLKPVMDGYNMAAGKGVHYWCFAQSLSALDTTWGREHRKTIMDLAEVVQILGFPRTDADGAESLSKAIGTGTFESRTQSRSGSVSGDRVLMGSSQTQEGDSLGVVRERLVTPDELMTLGGGRQFVIASAKDLPRDALSLQQVRYWEHEETRWLADPNPFAMRKKKAKEAAA